jgi:hypothetical protein
MKMITKMKVSPITRAKRSTDLLLNSIYWYRLFSGFSLGIFPKIFRKLNVLKEFWIGINLRKVAPFGFTGVAFVIDSSNHDYNLVTYARRTKRFPYFRRF